MLRAEVNSELLGFSAQELSLGRLDPIVGIFVLQTDLLRIFHFVDGPMEWELDRGTVSDLNFAARLSSWVGVSKVHRFERVYFEIHFLTID